MKTKPDQAGAAAAAELPAELRQLEQLAAGADAAVDGAAELQPGAAVSAPEIDKGAELGDMLCLGFQMGGNVLPPLPKYFTREACHEIGSAYVACAEKYGWTIHEKIGGPELRLGVAIVVPGFMAFMESKRYLEWKRDQDAKAEKAAAESRPLPLIDVH